MYNSSNVRRFMLILLILVVVFAPVSAGVKRAYSRVLEEPDDIVTTRKANFQLGDILGTPLVSITVVNDASPTYLLMVLNFDFGGTWDSEYAEVKLVRAMDANESLTFTNTDLLEYIPNIKDKSYSSTLKTKLGVTSMDDISSAFFNSGMALPEGTHTVTLKVYDIPTESIPSPLPSVLKEQSVSFNVVTIGSINVIETPRVDNQNLTFQVPEIPVYATSVQSTESSTKVKITGPGLDKTLAKNHTASVAGSASYKGFPGDLRIDDGYVTYDLSSIQFRAGERYQAEISFLDWNNADITTKTVDLTAFSTPRLYTDASFGPPYSPVFSWGFTGIDYSDWVKEYRVYLNGAYYGYTTSDSFTSRSPLVPNTTYSWYVMPINRDGSPFFASAAPLTKSFTTKAHTSPVVTLESPANGAVLIKGESYDFSSSTELFDDAELGTTTWRIGGETKSGGNVVYQPSKRYASGSLPVYASATDSFGYTGTSSTRGLTVLDPVVAISGGTARTVNKTVAASFSIDTGASRDVATYRWYVDGSEVGTGTRLAYTFDASGSHEVYASGTTVADMDGNTKTVDSAKISVTVVGAGPTVSIVQPTSSVELLLGSPLDIVASITNDNPLASTRWTITGADTQGGGTGSRFRFTPSYAGEHVITVTVTDVHGKSSSSSTRVMVVDPVIRMTSPAPNAVFALASTLTPTIEAPNAVGVTWYIGSTEVPGASKDLSGLGTGRYTTYAKGTWNVVDSQGKPMVYEKSTPAVTFQVKDLEPPVVTIAFPDSDTVFIAGTPYTLRAEVESASAIGEAYWEANGVRLRSDTYNPLSSSPAQIRLTHHVKNSDGVASSKSITVRKIDPSVVLTPPSTLRYPVGSVLPVTASVVDGDLYWLIDGVEYSTWNKVFSTAGTHRVQSGWRAVATNSRGVLSEYNGLSDPIDFTIYSTVPPSITSASPSSDIVQQKLDTNMTFSLGTTSDNPIRDVVWTKYIGSGTQYQVGDSYTGTAFTTSFSQSDLYTVKAVVTDTYGLSTLREWTVRAIDPKPVVSYPENGMVFALGAVPVPVVDKQGSTSFSLLLDEISVGTDFDWSSVGTGTHTLVAEGTYAGSTYRSDEVSFKVEDRTPPEFYLGIKDGERLISNQVYSILASYSTAGTPSVDSFTWFLDGERVYGSTDSGVGERYRFQHTVATSGIPETSTIKVRGTLNGISKDKSATVTILKPAAKAVLPESIMQDYGYFPMDTAIPLRFEGSHIDRIEWLVDGVVHTNPTVTFTDVGMHSIQMNAYVGGVRMPDNDKTDFLVGSDRGKSSTYSTDFDVVGKPSIQSLDVASQIYSGSKVPVSIVVQPGTDYLASIAYRVDGTLVKETRDPVHTSFELPALTAGAHSVEVVVIDIFGNTFSMAKPVVVHDPLTIALSKPTDGAKLTPATELYGELKVSSGTADVIRWSIDGRVVPNSNFAIGNLGRLPEGTHTVAVEVSDPLGTTIRRESVVDVQSDFQLTLLSPSDRFELISGDSTMCMVGVEKAPGSTVNLADAADHITWFVDGRQVGESGLSYLFANDSVGSHTIQARYEKGSMVRTTSERTIEVREMVAPTITTPLNGSTLTYAPGESIALRANGEPGATHGWELDGVRIASGLVAQFTPFGIVGEHQLKLKSTLHGKTLENLATITLNANTPPDVELTAKEKQFTGASLEWTVTAFDVEDNGVPALEFSWDGVILDESGKLLEKKDVGTHVLAVKATDGNGASTIRRTTVVVESDTVDLEIRSPKSGSVYYRNLEVPLQAVLVDPRISGGTISWSVQYLEDASLPVESLMGARTSFSPQHTGEIGIVARYHDDDGRERGSVRIPITVEAEPEDIQLIWPHGAVVDAGTQLRPELVGYDESTASYPVLWEIDGTGIGDISELRAPAIPGTHVLKALYWQGNGYESVSLQFTVNSLPVVTLEKPADGSFIKFGAPVMFTAKVTDDQPFKGTVSWTDREGSLLAEGSTMVLTDLPVGNHGVVVTVEDQFGAEGTADVSFRVYEPIGNIVARVNDNLPSFIVAPGTMPLPAQLEFTGGISPVVTWTLAQGDSSLVKQGTKVFFSYAELEQFEARDVTITCSVTDEYSDVEIFHKEHPVNLVDTATATLLSPTSETTFHVGDSVPVSVGLLGFSRPSFSLTIDGEPVTSTWTPMEGSLSQGTILPAATFSGEGVYELLVQVSENGFVNELPFTLNIYRSRQGIFVDDPPQTIDLTDGGIGVSAVVAGVEGVDSIRWTSDTSEVPFAYGLEATLSRENLSSGNRIITVQAWAGSTLVATTSFPITAFGAMEMEIQPQIDLYILQRGAPAELTVRAIDRDGTAITGEAITWESHLEGILGNSERLVFTDHPEIARGEHMLTVTAIGEDGTTISRYQRVQVNDPDAEETVSDEELEPQEELDVGDGLVPSGGGNSFDAGDPIAPYVPPDPPTPFGPGGSQMDPGLGGYMDNFMSGYDPYMGGGGYGGYDPYMGGGGYGGYDPYMGGGGYGGYDPYMGGGGYGGYGGWGY